MFTTNNLIKFGASACAALLILLFANWGASAIYQVAEDTGHGEHGEEDHGPARGFVIAAMDAEDHGDEEVVEVSFDEVYATADAAKGEGEFRACKACHKLEDGANSTGPHLWGLIDRPIASVDGFGYSDALLALQGENWTPQHLNDWIHDPKGYAPGNKMTYKGMKDIEDRANLIAYLATIGG